METKNPRGRPPKAADRRKAEYLDIRLEAAEKKAFRDAAEVAGLDLSAWVRERLRSSARKELEGVGRQPAFLKKSAKIKRDAIVLGPGPKDHVSEVAYVAPAKLFIRFADGLAHIWSFQELSLEMGNMKPGSVNVASAGTSISLKSKWNDLVEIDASSLRAAVDVEYAREVEIALARKRGAIAS